MKVAKKKGTNENLSASIQTFLNHFNLAKIIRKNFNEQVIFFYFSNFPGRKIECKRSPNNNGLQRKHATLAWCCRNKQRLLQ
jgi:hypothetical protein